jgi:tetrahydromethanopterin S-methyltransferase subunit G
LATRSINGNNLPFTFRDSHSIEMSDPCRMVLSMTTTLLELDERVSVLEQFVRHDLSVKVDAMNWALGQTYANTEATRQDVAGIKVDMAHLEGSVHADMASLKTSLDLRVSDVRRDLRTTEASIRHDMRRGFEAVNRRFDGVDRRFTGVDQRFDTVDQRFDTVDQRFAGVDQRFDAVDQRFDGVDQRFDRLEAKVDTILAEIRNGKN